MQINPYAKKGLAVGIILLFIGVAVGPSINFNAVKAASDNDFIEVTTQACGIKGFGNTTVKLTKQQYQNLEQYLADFRSRLNQTITREEAVPIFKEAVVELNKLGLLPKGMTIEQLQKLVTDKYQNEKIMSVLVKIYNKNKGIFNNSNFLCLVAGETSNVSFYGFPVRPFMTIAHCVYAYLYFFIKFFNITPPFPFSGIWALNLILLYLFYTISSYPSLPIKFMNYIKFGEQRWNYSSPAHGWVSSLGLLGKKHWEKSFFGDIFPVSCGVMGAWVEYDFGGTGFTGISISSQQRQTTFFLGTAIHIQIRQV